MQIVLVGRNYINKMVLPQNVVGNYWLCEKVEDREQKLINIEAREGIWFVNSKQYAKIFEMQENGEKLQWVKVEDSIALKEYEFYGVQLGESKEMFLLYCAPVLEKYTHLKIKDKHEICIGNGKNNQITYYSGWVAECHAKLHYENGKWLLENYDTQFGVFVNSKVRHKDARVLNFGDVVWIMGLKIILMGDSIYINSPKEQCFWSKDVFELVDDVAENLEEEKDKNNDEKDEEEYFSRSPRLTDIIEEETIKIGPPPAAPEKEETPMILLLGSSITMGLVMLMSVVRTIDSSMSGKTDVKQTIFAMITSVAMLIGIIVFPIASMKYEKKKKKKKEEKRQKKYKQYLEEKQNKINEIREKQKGILLKNYLTAKECERIIIEKDSRLWERKIDDYDFLTIRLGVGNVPLKLNIQYPEEQFSLEDDNLVKAVHAIAENSKKIQDAPIVVSLAQKYISAIISHGFENLDKYLKELIIQLITFQSYQDLKLVFLMGNDKNKKWDYVKMLPHVWDDAKELRFVTDNFDEMNEISKYLSEVFNNRVQAQKKDYKAFMPYYLIITDDYKKIENLKIITEILKLGTNVGFGLLCITDDLTQLPNECTTFIEIKDNKGTMFENKISSNSQQDFTFDTNNMFYFEKILNSISNVPIRYSGNGNNLLPNHYTFLEMYDVGRIEQLNVLERWSKNDSTLSLKAPLGVDKYGMLIYLDIHEKFHGPHGLIAGSTGSGKSEFIITYILSLAINYHPDDVNFILIDYKGGGLSGAFQKRNMKLPHLVGSITNIDTAELQRSLLSIQSELKRRQVIFNKARELTDEGTIDIYKYQRLYHKGIVKTPVAHLIIICDEFAELKQQQPDFMDELMSVSRIGRSLGVHLILATQKPAGIVNDQIRSNSKFAICLKVQDKSDSMDVINRPDAALLKRAGQFYMQVGYNEYFVLGQSGWSGAPYIPSDLAKKEEDNSVEFISNTGTIIYQLEEEKQQVAVKQGEQLTNIVKYLSDLAQKTNIKKDNLWKPSIPKDIYLEELKEKYQVKKIKNAIEVVIGEFDDPANQNQGVIQLDISNNVNIYGNAESGKETLLSTMIYDLMTTYTPQEVQMYIFDFGSEALKVYKKAPHVGDVVFLSDIEKISRFFEMLQSEIAKRKNILSNYNGEYELYLKEATEPMPRIVIILNNFEAFMELYENQYEDLLLTLTREGVKYGISFVTTINSYNGMRYRLTQNFKQKIALQINHQDDYLNIFENIGKKKLPEIFGRGFVELERNVYEFQTAKVSESEEYSTILKEKIETLNQIYDTFADPIPVLPKVLKYNDISNYLQDLTNVPIGVTKKDIKVYRYNFVNRFINVISGKNMEEVAKYTTYLLGAILSLKNIAIKIFDAERIVQTKKVDIRETFEEWKKQIKMRSDEFNICAIFGIDKFISEYETPGNTFMMALKEIESNGNCIFIIAESDTKLKSQEYSEWAKKYFSKDNAIWVGSGVENQYTFNITDRKDLVNKCGPTFGYAIKQGTAYMIKLLEMREEDDDE